jgi:hypothetical protein
VRHYFLKAIDSRPVRNGERGTARHWGFEVVRQFGSGVVG